MYHQVKVLIILLTDLIFRIYKYILFNATGRHEFERICDLECDIHEKTIRIESWLNRTGCRSLRNFIAKNLSPTSEDDKSSSPFMRSIRDLISQYSAERKSTTKNSSGKLKCIEPGSGSTNFEDGDNVLNLRLREMTDKFVKLISRVKNSKRGLSRGHQEILRDILYRILCHKMTLAVAEQLASTKYDPEKPAHRRTLIRLWNNLTDLDKDHMRGKKHEPTFPERFEGKFGEGDNLVSSKWSHIGFQGEDPATDFRGMGLLGLIQLEYLSRRANHLPIDILRRSLDDKHGYPFAIVGINLTFVLISLLKDGYMKHFFYDTNDLLFRNKQRSIGVIRTLNNLYVELFIRFDCFWHASKPENIMAFRMLMKEFLDIIQMDLCNRNFSLKFIY